MKIITVQTPEELTRLFSKLDDEFRVWKIGPNERDLRVDTIRYHISPGVILNLIDSEWLIPSNTPGMYEFDHDRDDEWDDLEQQRIEAARILLKDRYPAKLCIDANWVILNNPESAEQDARGFVFKDQDGYEYLVCEGRRILPLLKKVVTMGGTR